MSNNNNNNKKISSIVNSNSNEKEYLHVKRSLEVLGYKDPLGIDSVQVVNKVLNDLIKTTEAFKKLQDERNLLKDQIKSQNEIVLPLRNENMKLTKENNELHNEIIKLKDNIDNKNLNNNDDIKKYEDENNDLKFLNNQKDNKIKNLINEESKGSINFDKNIKSLDDLF